MRSYLVVSSYAPPRPILARDMYAAIRHYQQAYVLNGGTLPTESVTHRVYAEGSDCYPVSQTRH